MNSYYNGFQRFPQLLRTYKYFPQRLPRLLNGEARCAARWGLPGRATRRAAPPCPAKQASPCGAPRLPVPLGPCPLRRAAPPCPTRQARNPQGGQEGLPQRFQGTKKKWATIFCCYAFTPQTTFQYQAVQGQQLSIHLQQQSARSPARKEGAGDRTL